MTHKFRPRGVCSQEMTVEIDEQGIIQGLQVMGGMYLPIGDGSLLSRILYPGFDLAWAFYLPSQMLLAVSLLPKRWSESRRVPAVPESTPNERIPS